MVLMVSGGCAGALRPGRPRGHERPRGLGRHQGGGGLKTAANLEALGVKAKHKSHGVKAKHKLRGTWNQKVEDDLEAVNHPEALDDPWWCGRPRGTRREGKIQVSWREGKTQVSWREGKTEVSWVRSIKIRPSRTWNTKGRGRPRGLGRPRGGAADLEALGVKAKHKFRGGEAPKQDQVGLGTKRFRDGVGRCFGALNKKATIKMGVRTSSRGDTIVVK
nr:hypothetical protein Iba_chr03bCG3210 [Ipomoea batatas]